MHFGICQSAAAGVGVLVAESAGWVLVTTILQREDNNTIVSTWTMVHGQFRVRAMADGWTLERLEKV